MKQTLLEKAKATKVNRRLGSKVTDEHIELAFGWLRGEVRLTQMNKALEKNPQRGNVLYFVATCLKVAYEQGKIKIIK